MLKARFEDQKKINTLTKRFSRARSLSFFSEKKNISIYSRIKKENSKKMFSVDEKTHRNYSAKKANSQANQRNSSFANEESDQESSRLNIKKDELKDRIIIHINEPKNENDNDRINNNSNSLINYSYSSDTKKKSDEESERKIMKDILDQLKISNAHNTELIKKMNETFERMDKREGDINNLINMMKDLLINQRQNSGDIISGNNNNINKNK